VAATTSSEAGVAAERESASKPDRTIGPPP
jgi:hypothetical protein